MLVFLRRIPANTRKSDIVDFITPALQPKKLNPFSKKGHIHEVKILVMKDNDLNALEYHGIVKIEPDSAAQRVITKLNRKRFLNKHIAVRQYFHRSWHNDPRQQSVNKATDAKKLRKGDRRRSRMEVVEDITKRFSSEKNFHRRL